MNHCWCGSSCLLPWNKEYAKCSVCETLIDLSEHMAQPDSVDSENYLYNSDYWLKKMVGLYKEAGLNTLDDIILYHYRERAAYWVQHFIRHLLPPARVIELGCGMGTFTHWISRLGYEASATELSPSWRAIVKEKLGIAISGDSLTAIVDKEGKFDAIVMLDVLEHLPDPLSLFGAVSNALKPDGILMVQMPEYTGRDSYESMRRKQLSFIRYLIPQEHVFLYSPKGIDILLAKFDFIHKVHYKSIFADDMFFVASRVPIKAHDDEMIIKAFMKPDAIAPYAALKNYQMLREREAFVRKNLWHVVKKAIKKGLHLIR